MTPYSTSERISSAKTAGNFNHFCLAGSSKFPGSWSALVRDKSCNSPDLERNFGLETPETGNCNIHWPNACISIFSELGCTLI
jgi:hypothetical protein